MPVTTFSKEEINTFVSEIKKQLIPVLLQEMQGKQLPPLLTRKQFMEVADISDAKCNQLFHRSDFPVTRELGHPRVPTKLFFEWLHKSCMNEMEVPMKRNYKVI